MIEKNILLVEDEISLAETLKLNLECDGYCVTLAHSGSTATGLLSKKRFDLIILDVMLPEMDGYQICRLFRETDTSTPVLFLSARGSSSERIQGLKIGANDYVAKPFEYDELLLRINNLITFGTAQQKSLEHYFEFGKSRISFHNMTATGVEQQTIHLSKIEYEMMKFFIMNQNRVITREELYSNIWGYNNKTIPNSRTLDNFIVSLRKYFEENPSEPKHIISIRGFGYKFVR